MFNLRIYNKRYQGIPLDRALEILAPILPEKDLFYIKTSFGYTVLPTSMIRHYDSNGKVWLSIIRKS